MSDKSTTAEAKTQQSQEPEDVSADSARHRRRRRRFWFALILTPIGLLAAYTLLAHLSGGALPSCGLPLGGDRGELRRTTVSFWEDVKFKDYDHAATYHAPEVRDEIDIPYLLKRLLAERPEMVEIQDYEVLQVDIDSTDLRARVKSRVRMKHLGTGKASDREVLLFYKRADQTAPWYMELEDSLRAPDSDPNKRH
ncbi:MAG: hypothetical protein AUK47_23385 [Deltaproteobacteria bacterium CG2_30_63_29]|nr:MAG: hypothetical protein AUK47_23385 [Deltaproteobacteria bacterium CG2_30_63_29]PJB40071.1 MAG: hypothetical protein CO108_15705 [Deltaproteobacteria bacterium CG_4_9_14_3_um_filter_63_12]